MKLIYNIAKIIGALVVITSAAYGAITFIFKQGIDSERKQNKTVNLEIKVERLIINDSLRTVRIEEFQKVLEENTKATEANTKVSKSTATSLANHYKLSNKIDELYLYMQEQEAEKKNYNYLWIQPDTTLSGIGLGWNELNR